MPLTEIYFIGRDGGSYPDSGSLTQANAAWKEANLRPIEKTIDSFFIGRDVGSYTDLASLAKADAAWKKANLRPIERTLIF